MSLGRFTPFAFCRFIGWLAFTWATCVATKPALAAESPRAAAAARPNIVVVLVDDQGWADMGCHGQVADVPTPHVDALARRGVTCLAGYITAPQCSPSRAGLLTGRYQQRYGIDAIPDMPLPREARTLAERLTPLGYRTGFVGKWHLEPNRLCQSWLTCELPQVTRTSRPGS